MRLRSLSPVPPLALALGAACLVGCALPGPTPPQSSPVYAALPANLEPVPMLMNSSDQPETHTITPSADSGKADGSKPSAEAAQKDASSSPTTPAAEPAAAPPSPVAPAPVAPAAEPPTAKPDVQKPAVSPPPAPIPQPAKPGF